MEPQLLGEIRLVMADDLSGYLKVTDGKLDLVLARLNTLQETVNIMSAEVDRLKASVVQLATVDQSVITLLRGMSDQIRALKQDPAALTALADEVDARVKELGDAVTANTATTTTQAATPTTVASPAGGAPTAGGQTGGPEAGKSTRLKWRDVRPEVPTAYGTVPHRPGCGLPHRRGLVDVEWYLSCGRSHSHGCY
jgi:uncharacterized protein YoxC